MVHPLLTQLVLGLAPYLLPFDLETYLRYHFTKVGAQTRAAIAVYMELGAALGLPSAHLEQLFRENETGV
jgi:2-dehydropantoate 2-reductase